MGRPLRILMVTQALYPDLIGGAPIGAHRLASGLVAAGHDVEVHTVDYGRSAEGPAVAATYRIVRHKTRWTPWDRLGTAGNPWTPGLRAAVARADADVVHLRSHLFLTSVQGLKGAHDAGKPTVLSVHGVRAVRGPFVNALQEAWLRTLGRSLLRRADRVVCLTRRDQDEVLRYGASPERSAVLFNSYDDELFRPTAGERDRTILWAGRHVPEKGLDILLKAWSKVAPAHPGWRLALVGDGPLLKERRRQAAALGVGSSVGFVPAQSQAKVAERMARAAVFVLPSLREGFPISLAEAMGCGCPIVTTQGLEEVTADAALYVPPGDDDALAQALERLMDDGALRDRMGRAGLARARTRFSPAALAQAYVEVYRQAMAEGPKPTAPSRAQ